MALKELRKASTSKVANVLILLLVLSFVGWGVNDVLRGPASRGVARVGNQWISTAQYQQRYRTVIDQLNRGATQPLTTEQITAMGVKGNVLQNLIDWTALDILAFKLGLAVHDDSLKRQITSMTAFQGIDGKFDTMTYQSRLLSAGYTPAGFESEMRKEIVRAQLRNAVGNGSYLPRGLIEDLLRYRGEMRQISYVVVDPALAGTVATPDDAALKKYIDDHSDRYSRPELRTFVAVLFRPADFASKVEVTPDEIKQSYEFDIDRYRVPERRALRAIAFPDQQSARVAYDDIKGGRKTFEQVGKERGYADADLAFKDQARSEVADPKVADAVFAAAQPELLAPVDGDLAWTIAEFKSVTPEIVKPLADVQDEIKTKLALDHAQENIEEVVTQFLDGRAGGQTDEELANQLGLGHVKFEAVDNKGNNVDGLAQGSAIPEQQQLLDAAFAAEQGVDSDPAFLKDGGSFVVRVDQVDPPAIKPFDKIAEQARRDYLAEEQRKRITAKANELASKYRVAGIGALAAAMNTTPIVLPMPVRRDDESETLSKDLIAALFAAKQGEPVVGSAIQQDTVLIATATAVAAPNAQELAQGIAAVSERIDQALADDVLQQYTNDAKQSLGVRVDQAALDAAATGQ